MTSTFGEASFLCPLATPKDYYADLWPVNRKEPTRRPSTPPLLYAGTQSPECLAKRDLRSRDGEDGKTALQRDGRATHGVARVAINTAEERFFHPSTTLGMP